ncbi:MAG: DNA-binding response regulator, partial [Planctomycetota bacterium]
MPHDALKLLFVDDEDGLRTTFCRELRRAGYEVVDCPDGASAL